MSITMELAPEVENLAKAKAEAQGITLEDYLPALLAQAVQEDSWQEDNASMATIMGSEATMRRLWDTPEEDEAWKDL
jgi:hypothetical protein